MNRPLKLLFISLLAALWLFDGRVVPLHAEVVMTGQVCYFDGKEKRRAIPGVEVQAIGAPSTVTDRNGYFRLRFRVLKPGDRIRFRQIYKPGFSVLNQESVDAMVIPNDSDYVLTIVMSNDKQKELTRQAYFVAASKHFNAQLRKEETHYKAELKSGRMSPDDYHKKIQQVRNDYENRLFRAEEYINHFVDVDISQLGATEKQILQLIRKGKYEQALDQYNRQQLLEKINRQTRYIEEERKSARLLNSALQSHRIERDSIYDVLRRQVTLLRMSGGTKNYAKAMSLLRSAAYADTTYDKAVYHYARMCYNQLYYKESLEAFRLLSHHAQDTAMLFESLVMQGASLRMLKRVDEAEVLLLQALQLGDSIEGLDNSKASAYYHIGHVCRQRHDYEASAHYFQLAFDNFLKHLKADTTVVDSWINVARAQIYCGRAASLMGETETAVRWHEEALRYINHAYLTKPRRYTAMLAFGYQFLALDYTQAVPPQVDKSMHYLQMADTLYQRAVHYNPEAYLSYLADLYSDMGNNCVMKGDTLAALSHYRRSTQVYGEFLTMRPDNVRAINNLRRNNEAIVHLLESYREEATFENNKPALP